VLPPKRAVGDNTGSVNIINISSDGNVLAYGVKYGGTDSQSVQFIDVASRRVLPDCLPPGFCRGLVFSSDSKDFYYSHEPIDS